VFFLYSSDSKPQKFATKAELEEYIELHHAKSGGFDWISEIKDDKGNYYGCSWKLEVEEIR
jgi:hypothetical protein